MGEANGCIFCRIISGEIPARIVAEGDAWLAFHDVDPKAPTHVLVIPRRHIASLNELTSADAAVAGELVLAAAGIARRLGVAEAGYRVVVNAGTAAGQSVDHIHFHMLAGRHMAWPPG